MDDLLLIFGIKKELYDGCKMLVQRIRNFFNLTLEVKICHIYCETNSCTDKGFNGDSKRLFSSLVLIMSDNFILLKVSTLRLVLYVISLFLGLVPLKFQNKKKYI